MVLLVAGFDAVSGASLSVVAGGVIGSGGWDGSCDSGDIGSGGDGASFVSSSRAGSDALGEDSAFPTLRPLASAASGDPTDLKY